MPQVEVTLVMPSQTPGKETSGDTESVILPDSVSLGDDLHINSKSFLSCSSILSLSLVISLRFDYIQCVLSFRFFFRFIKLASAEH